MADSPEPSGNATQTDPTLADNSSACGRNAAGKAQPTPTPQCKSSDGRTLQLLDLPIDIQHLIMQCIIRPTDLKNVCLTCKSLHEIAVRQLYHEVTLDVGSALDTRLTSLVNPRNKGVQHIRKLDLYLAHVKEKLDQTAQYNLAIRMLLEFLPEDQLEKFSWHPWDLFSSENLMLLYRKQRRMKWLEAIALDKDILSTLEAWPGFDAIFTNVSKLGFYPDNREVLNLCGALLKRSPKVEKITLHTNFDDDHEPVIIPARELNDSSTGAGLITRTIFGHMLPWQECSPLTLRDLTLQKINLRYAADTYCKVIDFRGIQALRVFGCSGADSLFAELSKSQKLPEKLQTLEFKHDDNNENDALHAMDGFLCLVSGLKVLTLDICYAKTLPAVAGITRHSRTLEELNVHASRGDGEEEELVFSFEDFDKICKDCDKLEQLSVAFPATKIYRASSDAFSAFETALGDLPNLITLNITTWPASNQSGSQLPRKVYEHLLQGMAQAGFEQSMASAAAGQRSSKLSVIAWGASEKTYVRQDAKNQIIFVKGKQIDPFGQESPLAVQISWCLRRYIEPRSDILDFALARDCAPPTKEPPQSDDSD